MISNKDLFPEQYQERPNNLSWNAAQPQSHREEPLPMGGANQRGELMTLMPDDGGSIMSSSSSSSSDQEKQPDPTPSDGSTKKLAKFKTILERLLSNPLVSFFTCPADYSPARGFQNAIETRAPKAVCHTMRRFPHNVRVQNLGLRALHDLAMDSWPMKDQIIQAGGIDLILKAMRLHQKDIQIQEVACRCLYHLIAGYASAMMVDRGVVVALLATIEHHLDEEDVLPVACDCLLALTDNSSEALETMRHKLGGVVLAKMEEKYRGKNGGIRQKAGELLRRLYVTST